MMMKQCRESLALFFSIRVRFLHPYSRVNNDTKLVQSVIGSTLDDISVADPFNVVTVAIIAVQLNLFDKRVLHFSILKKKT